MTNRASITILKIGLGAYPPEMCNELVQDYEGNTLRADSPTRAARECEPQPP